MSKKENRAKRRLCELPPLTGAPCIELNGNREAVIEGCRGVLEYTTECIRINTAGMVLVLSGRELNLRCISDSALIVDGFLTGLEFST